MKSKYYVLSLMLATGLSTCMRSEPAQSMPEDQEINYEEMEELPEQPDSVIRAYMNPPDTAYKKRLARAADSLQLNLPQ